MSENNSTNGAFEALLEYLQRTRGFDFTGYKRTSLMRRVARRMQTDGIDKYGDYLDYLEVHPEEFVALFNTILINVTGFFRDPEAWTYIGGEILPAILNNRPAPAPIRVWCAGVASGEEAYSVAMLLAEAVGIDAFRERVKIYATDVDEQALAQARQASYDLAALESVPADLRTKYFEQAANTFVFRADIRRCAIFGRHDLIQDAPISRLDLLVCRNTLMYFNSETQSRILGRFHFALNDEGFLFLGKAEMLLTHASLFTPVDLKFRVFSKQPRTTMRDRLLVLAQTGDEEANNRLNLYLRLRDSAFEYSTLAQVVVDSNGILALANERARTLFSLGARDLGRPFSDLELSYRPLELRSRIEQAYSEHRPVVISQVERFFGADKDAQYLDVHITPMQNNGGNVLGVLISFTDSTRQRQLQDEVQRTKQDLETAYEELQSANEELETTNEELQSANEELQTTNEELQSTNEELETMNEELQSTNEELEATNTELQTRTLQLDDSNAFLASALDGLSAAVVILNTEQTVVYWNRLAEETWGLRADEVRGKSFFKLDIGLPISRLATPIHDCLRGQCPSSTMSVDATNRRGKAIRSNIAFSTLIGPRGERRGVILMMEETER